VRESDDGVLMMLLVHKNAWNWWMLLELLQLPCILFWHYFKFKKVSYAGTFGMF